MASEFAVGLFERSALMRMAIRVFRLFNIPKFQSNFQCSCTSQQYSEYRDHPTKLCQGPVLDLSKDKGQEHVWPTLSRSLRSATRENLRVLRNFQSGMQQELETYPLLFDPSRHFQCPNIWKQSYYFEGACASWSHCERGGVRTWSVASTATVMWWWWWWWGGLRFVLSNTLNILENFFIVNTRNKQTQFSQSKSVHKLGLEPLRRQQGCNWLRDKCRHCRWLIHLVQTLLVLPSHRRTVQYMEWCRKLRILQKISEL